MSRLADAFIEFHHANPHVYVLFDKFTKEIIDRGLNRYSVDAIFHRMRWHTDVETQDPDGYKLNDHYTAFYARLWMTEHPEHKGFFRCRPSQADNLFATGSEA